MPNVSNDNEPQIFRRLRRSRDRPKALTFFLPEIIEASLFADEI